MKKTTASCYLAVCYADIFDYPLKEEELERWGISVLSLRGASKTSDVAISTPICHPRESGDPYYIDSRLHGNDKKKKVARNDIVVEKDGFYCLNGREKIIKLRQERVKYSHQKLIIAQKIAWVLKKNPLVKMVAVTGALAMENSAKNDDIDLLIVTGKNRVWLTRSLTTLTLDILGKRRKRNDKDFSDKICLNMFLDETELLILLKEQNLYTAHEICQVKPLYNQSQTYEKFMLTNKWVKKYLPSAFSLSLRGSPPTGGRRGNLNEEDFHGPDGPRNDTGVIGTMLDFLEIIAFKLQYYYMKKHITRETVTPNRIMFHPKDTNKMVLEEFNKRIKVGKI